MCVSNHIILLIGKVPVIMHFCRCKSALESGQEGRIVQIDFTAAFDGGIMDKLCSVGIVGSVAFTLTKFLSQHVMVDGCRSVLVNVVSGMPQGSVLGPVVAPLVHLEAFFLSGK